MKGLKETDGFFIAGWMRTRLDLKGAELVAYALVHQFSQSSAGIYKGGVNYLSAWLGCSYRSAFTYLKNLVQKGYINEITGKENGVPYCYYTANLAEDMQNFPKGTANLADRIIDKNINNKERDIQRFTPPTIEDVKAYCEARNNGIDAEEFVAFYSSKGWMVGRSKMKDWRSAVITWEKARAKERKVPPKERKRESVFEHNLKVADEMFGTNYHEKVYGKKEVDCDDQ